MFIIAIILLLLILICIPGGLELLFGLIAIAFWICVALAVIGILGFIIMAGVA